MRQSAAILCFFILGSFNINILAQAKDFPGRELYRDVAVIELKDLNQRYEDVVIIDVRSQFEFNTLRIKGARNLPLASREFSSQLRDLRKASIKPFVFYCNGRSCTKSYEAVRKARLLAGIKQSYAFDAGINDWAKVYPERSVLLGKSPIDVNDVIGNEKFNAHLLSPVEFKNKIGASSLVLDVRDRFQRKGASLFGTQEQRVPLDESNELQLVMQRAIQENKTLLIYDAVGKQVRWLQYQLEKKKVPSYYFMRGGAEAYFKQL